MTLRSDSYSDFLDTNRIAWIIRGIIIVFTKDNNIKIVITNILQAKHMNPLYIGIGAGVFTALAMLPQLIKIIKTKEAKEISVKTYLILLTGLALWVLYGIVQGDYPVIITNAFSSIVNLLIVIFSLKYRKNENA